MENNTAPPVVLHVIVGLDAGGAELMLARLVLLSQSQSRFRHVVLSLKELGSVGSQLHSKGVEVHTLKMKGLLGLPLVFFRLVQHIRRVRPTILQTWMYHADLLGGIAARLAGCEIVLWGIRGSDIPNDRWSPTWIVAWLCARLSSRVPTKIICCAEAARVAHRNRGYDGSKMMVIPNGCDLELFHLNQDARAAARTQMRLGADEIVVGVVGRFDPLKDYPTFVSAASIVADRHPNVKFMMVGRRLDAENSELRGLIRESKCADRFLLLGEQSNIHDWFSAMDVFCLSSTKEGFPNVVCEAMAMNLPCVVTDAGDARLIVGDSGIVVETCSPERLADGLTAIICKTDEERKGLGELARRRVEAHFSISRAVAAFESLYLDQLAHIRENKK